VNIIRFFLEDLPLKIISILIAGILWFHSATEKIYIAQRDVILEYQEIPENITFREIPPNKIKVLFEAKGKELIKLYFSKPKIRVNLKEKKEGKEIIKIKEEDLKIRKDIKFEKIILTQNTIILNFEKKESKKVKVKIEYSGKPREGYGILKITPEENEIFLIGPKSVVEKIDEVKSEEIDVSGKKFSFYDYVKFLPPSVLTTLSPSSLRVYVEIEEEEKKEVEKNIMVISPENYDVQIEPEKVKIKIKGVKSIIHNLNPEEISVFLNLIEFGEGEYYIPPKIFPIEGITVEEFSPSFIRVILKKKTKLY